MIRKEHNGNIVDILDRDGKVVISGDGEKTAEAGETDLFKVMDMIRESIHEVEKYFMMIAYALYVIKEKKLYLAGGYPNIYSLAENEFQLTKSTTSRYIRICREFSKGHNSACLDERYSGFHIGQLFEMLSMEPEERKKITPDMQVKVIREIKKRGIPSPLKFGGQKGLPRFWNDAERREWLEDVESWGLWYEDDNLHARYYKYDFNDGNRLIAVRYRDTCQSDITENLERQENETEMYGSAYYHMLYSEAYIEKHPDEIKSKSPQQFCHDTVTIKYLVKFLREMAPEEDSDPYTWYSIEFDTSNLGKSEIGKLPAAARHYAAFYCIHKYIPAFFNLKDEKEVRDYAPTLCTGSGNPQSNGGIAVFDISKNIMDILDDETISDAEKGKSVRMLMSIACPEEKERMEGAFGHIPGWDEWIKPYEGKVKFYVRSYTPEECFELMGMRMEDVEKCRAIGVSNAALFKQTGNGIVTNCVQGIIENLYEVQSR